MANTASTIEFKASPVRLAGLALGGVIMTAASFAIAWPLLPDVGQESFLRFVGWVGLFLFAAGTLVIVWRIIGPKKLSLVLAPDGFHHTSVSSAPIAWKNVQGLSSWSYHGTTLLIVKVSETVWTSGGLSKTARWSRSANQRLGIDGVALPLTGLPIKFDELFSLFQKYVATYGPHAG